MKNALPLELETLGSIHSYRARVGKGADGKLSIVAIGLDSSPQLTQVVGRLTRDELLERGTRWRDPHGTRRYRLPKSCAQYELSEKGYKFLGEQII